MFSEPPFELIPVSILDIVKPSPFTSPPLVRSRPTPIFPEPDNVASDVTVTNPPSTSINGYEVELIVLMSEEVMNAPPEPPPSFNSAPLGTTICPVFVVTKLDIEPA